MPPGVPILQVLCLGAIFWPVHVINPNVLAAQGYSNLYFRLEIITNSFGCGLFAAGSFFGVIGIAWSQAAFCFLAFAANTYYTKRHLNYGFAAQVRDLMPIMSLSLVAAATMGAIDGELELSPILRLIIFLPIVALVFLCLSGLFRLAVLRDLKELLAI
jgi:teichuronic acid exporter